MRNELKKFHKVLSPNYAEYLNGQREDEEVLEDKDGEQMRSSREAFVKITLYFLKRMKQEELVDRLKSSKRICSSFFSHCLGRLNFHKNSINIYLIS